MSEADTDSFWGEIDDTAAQVLVDHLVAGHRRIRFPLLPGWQLVPDPLPAEDIQPDELHNLAMCGLEAMPIDEIMIYVANRRRAGEKGRGRLTIVPPDDEAG